METGNVMLLEHGVLLLCIIDKSDFQFHCNISLPSSVLNFQVMFLEVHVLCLTYLFYTGSSAYPTSVINIDNAR